MMTCNISNTFSDVTIQLKNRIIFDEVPQGNFRFDGWELQVQGGQARLMIKDTQDVHTGLYFWHLHGLQRNYRFTTLNVSEPANKERTDATPSDPVKHSQQEVGPDTLTLVGVLVTVILILGLTGIGALICYRRHRSSKFQWIRASAPDLRRF